MFTIGYALGSMLATFAVAYLVPAACSVLAGDGLWRRFLISGAVTALAGITLCGSTRARRRELKPRDGFLLITLVCVSLSAAAALPILLARPELGFTRAYFEALSGLTTTGSTVLSGLDELAPSLNLWRHLLQWLGGLGIIIVAVAVLPMLGIGGMQLHRSETPGPMKSDRLTPRITEAAKSLWYVYAALTLAAVVALKLCGLSWLDAVCHAFSAVSLGGFSTHDSSIGYFDSPAVEAVLTVIVLLASLNFGRHFLALRRRSLATYTQDPESRALFTVIGGSVLGIFALLCAHAVYPSAATVFRHTLFNVVSVATTTGYVTQDYGRWPLFAPFWMLLLSGIACSTGTAGGGIKMFRTLLLTRQAGRELRLLLHPSAVTPVRIGGRAVPERVADAVFAFVFVYFVALAVLTFALLLSGLDFESALGASAAAINNTAHGLGSVGPTHNYASLTAVQSWIIIAGMLLGRLEILSIIILFTPGFWRR